MPAKYQPLRKNQLLDETYHRVNFDRELVFKFFTVFSLFEYALKKAGFTRSGRNEDVHPNWDAFAESIHGSYDPTFSPELKIAIDYLLNDPPKKQVTRNGHIVFRHEPACGETDTKKLSIYIRRIRNNLFHGGKFGYDRPRDTLLIQSALFILEAWANCDTNVANALKEVG